MKPSRSPNQPRAAWSGPSRRERARWCRSPARPTARRFSLRREACGGGFLRRGRPRRRLAGSAWATALSRTLRARRSSFAAWKVPKSICLASLWTEARNAKSHSARQIPWPRCPSLPTRYPRMAVSWSGLCGRICISILPAWSTPTPGVGRACLRRSCAITRGSAGPRTSTSSPSRSERARRCGSFSQRRARNRGPVSSLSAIRNVWRTASQTNSRLASQRLALVTGRGPATRRATAFPSIGPPMADQSVQSTTRRYIGQNGESAQLPDARPPYGRYLGGITSTSWALETSTCVPNVYSVIHAVDDPAISNCLPVYTRRAPLRRAASLAAGRAISRWTRYVGRRRSESAQRLLLRNPRRRDLEDHERWTGLETHLRFDRRGDNRVDRRGPVRPECYLCRDR